MISKLCCTQENHVGILQKNKRKNIKQTQSTRKQEKNGNNIQKPQFTSQVEMLSCNCSECSTGGSYIHCPTATIAKGCHLVMQRVCQHQEAGRWTST